MKTNSVLETIVQRRSTRSYTETAISKEDMQTIVTAGTYAPTGMNRRSFHFTVISNPEKLAELNRLIRGAFLKSDEERLRKRGENPDYICYYNAPSLILVSNEPSQAWAAQDCACAVQNIFLAAHSLGIASCWINQLLAPTCDDPEVRRLLTEWGVPSDHKIYGCAALGYAAEALKEPAARKEGLVCFID